MNKKNYNTATKKLKLSEERAKDIYRQRFRVEDTDKGYYLQAYWCIFGYIIVRFHGEFSKSEIPESKALIHINGSIFVNSKIVGFHLPQWET